MDYNMDFIKNQNMLNYYGFSKEQYFTMDFDKQQLLLEKFIKLQSKINELEENNNSKKKVLNLFNKKI